METIKEVKVVLLGDAGTSIRLSLFILNKVLENQAFFFSLLLMNFKKTQIQH